MVYISVLANHSAEEILGSLTLVHPENLSSLVISNTLTDFCIKGGSVYEGVVFLKLNAHLGVRYAICLL